MPSWCLKDGLSLHPPHPLHPLHGHSHSLGSEGVPLALRGWEGRQLAGAHAGGKGDRERGSGRHAVASGATEGRRPLQGEGCRGGKSSGSSRSRGVRWIRTLLTRLASVFSVARTPTRPPSPFPSHSPHSPPPLPPSLPSSLSLFGLRLSWEEGDEDGSSECSQDQEEGGGSHDCCHMSLHVHCHVSGGHFLLSWIAALRLFIFRRELPVVLEAFRHGDRALLDRHPGGGGEG